MWLKSGKKWVFSTSKSFEKLDMLVNDTYWSSTSTTSKKRFKERVSFFRNFKTDLTVLVGLINKFADKTEVLWLLMIQYSSILYKYFTMAVDHP